MVASTNTHFQSVWYRMNLLTSVSDADKEGNQVIIEIKIRYAELSDVDQLQRYVKHCDRTNEASVRGILVAPEFGEKTKRELRETGLEKRRITEFQHQDLGPEQSSLGNWE